MDGDVDVPELQVEIPCDGAGLAGVLAIPARCRGALVFAHGTGSSRQSSRHRLIAQRLQHDGFATLLVDLLTPDEDAADAATAAYRFEVALLGERLTLAAEWLSMRLGCGAGSLGLFGASAGAAAALVAAANWPALIGAVVCCDGRPDLAGVAALRRVRAPTLLVAASRDDMVIELNRLALRYLQSEKRIEIVPGATHLFLEPGALERVAELAAGWFEPRLARSAVGLPGVEAPGLGP